MMVSKMSLDFLRWVVLFFWSLAAFSIFFNALFSQTYGRMSAIDRENDECPELDVDFEDLIWTMRYLLDASLSGSPDSYNCVGHTTKGYFALPMLYLWMLISNFMLINMLIAMMASTYEVRAPRRQKGLSVYK